MLWSQEGAWERGGNGIDCLFYGYFFGKNWKDVASTYELPE